MPRRPQWRPRGTASLRGAGRLGGEPSWPASLCRRPRRAHGETPRTGQARRPRDRAGAAVAHASQAHAAFDDHVGKHATANRPSGEKASTEGAAYAPHGPEMTDLCVDPPVLRKLSGDGGAAEAEEREPGADSPGQRAIGERHTLARWGRNRADGGYLLKRL